MALATCRGRDHAVPLVNIGVKQLGQLPMQIDIEQIQVVHPVGNTIRQGNASRRRGISRLGILLIACSFRTTESGAGLDVVSPISRKTCPSRTTRDLRTDRPSPAHSWQNEQASISACLWDMNSLAAVIKSWSG